MTGTNLRFADRGSRLKEMRKKYTTEYSTAMLLQRVMPSITRRKSGD